MTLAGNLTTLVQGNGWVDGAYAQARIGQYIALKEETFDSILIADNGRIRRMVLP